MKKCIAMLLAVVLMMGCLPAALADSVLELEAAELVFNKYNNRIAYRENGQDYFRLICADGTPLVTEEAGYTDIAVSSGGEYFEVQMASEDGVHHTGLISGDGQVLMPARYADIVVMDNGWYAGILLTPSSAEDKDYTYTNWTTNEKSFFRIDKVDVYYCGSLAGTLSRGEYSNSYRSYGAYLCITNAAGDKVFYNSKFEKSPYATTSSMEVDSIYANRKYTYYHSGTGQQMFVPECTLTADEVETAYMYQGGVIYDLQGNAVATTKQEYDSVSAFKKNGLTLVREDSKVGLIDINGNELIAPLYKSLSNYEDEMLAYGCISAVKDGKFGFLDANGQVTCDFVYSADVVTNRGTFATIKNLDGTTIVLSGLAGELPERYASVTMPSYGGCGAFVGENADGLTCIVDLNGNVLLPYGEHGYVNVSIDGKVAVLNLGSRRYQVITFGDAQAEPAAQEQETPAQEQGETSLLPSWLKLPFQQPATEAPAAETPAPQPEQETPAAPVNDGSWVCDNGHGGNMGKFCSECGSPKPVEKNQCAACGYDFGDTAPKFCPECGTSTAK